MGPQAGGPLKVGAGAGEIARLHAHPAAVIVDIGGLAVDVERRTEVVMGADEIAGGAPCQRAHVVEVGVSRVEARPHVIIGERTGDIGLEKPRCSAVHIGGREGRIEGDRRVKIRQRAVEIGLHMPLFPAHAIVGRIRAPTGRKRFIVLAGVQLRRIAAGRSLVFIGCHEIAVPAPLPAHNTRITFATSFPTRARRDIDPRQPQRRDLIRRPMVPSAAAGIIFIASYVA